MGRVLHVVLCSLSVAFAFVLFRWAGFTRPAIFKKEYLEAFLATASFQAVVMIAFFRGRFFKLHKLLIAGAVSSYGCFTVSLLIYFAPTLKYIQHAEVPLALAYVFVLLPLATNAWALGGLAALFLWGLRKLVLRVTATLKFEFS
jgi:hypothetical protein